jgi:tRNA 2-thiouridine synthesizing protein B
MPTLHTVNKSPFERNSLETCLSVCKSDASVLLIEDAVVGALQNTSISRQILEAVGSGVKVYALNEDLEARGLPPGRLIDEISIVDYAGFVNLAAENTTVQSWL